jgi:hypothetical protein
LLVMVLGLPVLPALAQSQAQAKAKKKSADSVFRDRTRLSKELISLRDSIDLELDVLAQHGDSISGPGHVERIRRKLRNEKTKVEVVLADVANSTRETWDYFVREKASNTIIQVAYDFHQLKKDLSKQALHRHL